MIRFWKEIGKMTIVPTLVATIGYFIMKNFEIDSWLKFFTATTCIIVIYIPLVWKFGMNESERLLISKPIKRVLNQK